MRFCEARIDKIMISEGQRGLSFLEYIIALVILSGVFLVASEILKEKGLEQAEFSQKSGSTMVNCGERQDGEAAALGLEGESCL